MLTSYAHFCTSETDFYRLVHSNRNNGVCVRHGAKVKTCTHEGCTKQARKGGVCRIHSQNDDKSPTDQSQTKKAKGEAD